MILNFYNQNHNKFFITIVLLKIQKIIKKLCNKLYKIENFNLIEDKNFL